MASVDLLVKAWGEAQWEFSLAFDGLSDDKVWERPHPQLLSIGELAGHVAYNEAMMTHYSGTDRAPEADDISLKSPLVDSAFKYYTDNIGEPVRLDMGAEAVKAEVARVHAEVKAAALERNQDSEVPVTSGPGSTWGQLLNYRIFHVAYHCGQAYTVRHLLGDTPPDN